MHKVRIFENAFKYQQWASECDVDVVSVVVFENLLVVTFRFLPR